MGKFDDYKIPLKVLDEGKHKFEYVLDFDYFKKIDSPEVEKGNVEAEVNLLKKNDAFTLDFHLKGVVNIPCDRCLDIMDQEIAYDGKLHVKFGSDYSQESEEIVVIPENEGELNIAWFLYEFIVLNIPVKHVHPSGECNKMMSSKLNEHLIDDFFEEEEETNEKEIDPRWDSLKDIKFNEND